MAKKELEAQAKKIMEMAEESGLQSNFFFVTTFQRYLVQINILEELEKEVNMMPMLACSFGLKKNLPVVLSLPSILAPML